MPQPWANHFSQITMNHSPHMLSSAMTCTQTSYTNRTHAVEDVSPVQFSTYTPLLYHYLQADLEALRHEQEQHVARLQEQAAAREAQLHREAEAHAQELYARIDALQAELDGVMEFKQRQVRAE